MDAADSLMKIGVIYSRQGRTGEAIERFAKALTLYKELGCSFESETAEVLEKLITCCITELEHALPHGRIGSSPILVSQFDF